MHENDKVIATLLELQRQQGAQLLHSRAGLSLLHAKTVLVPAARATVEAQCMAGGVQQPQLQHSRSSTSRSQQPGAKMHITAAGAARSAPDTQVKLQLPAAFRQDLARLG